MINFFGTTKTCYLLGLALLFSIIPNIQASSSNEPNLVLNTPFPSTLWRGDIASDGSSTLLVTAATNNSATVWNLDDLTKPNKILHFPLRNNKEYQKRSHGVAISPDLKFIAYGVQPKITKTKYEINTGRIYIVERISGKPVKNLKDGYLKTPAGTHEIKFSPDGKYMAASFSDGCGLRVWTTNNWLEAYNYNYANCGYDDAKDFTSIKFNKDQNAYPWIAAVSREGIYLFEKPTNHSKGKQVAILPKEIIHTEKLKEIIRPYTIDISDKFSNKLNLLAVGDMESSKIALIPIETDAENNSVVKIDDIHIKTLKGDRLPKVSFSKQLKDGKQQHYLYAAGYSHCNNRNPTAICGFSINLGDGTNTSWVDMFKKKPTKFKIGTNTVMDIINIKKADNDYSDGVLIVDLDGFVAIKHLGDPLFTSKTNKQYNHNINHRNKSRDSNLLGIDISKDANQIELTEFGAKNNKRFKINILKYLGYQREDSRMIKQNKNYRTALANYITTVDENGEEKEPWQNKREGSITTQESGILKINSVFLTDKAGIESSEQYRSAALLERKDKDTKLLIGSSNVLRIIDAKSAQTRCRLGIKHEAYRVNITVPDQIIAPEENLAPDKVNETKAVAVVAHSDGIIRWYRIDNIDSDECSFNHYFSLLVRHDSQLEGNWSTILWAPDGYFFTRDLNEMLIGWQFDDYSSSETRFHKFQVFRDTYNSNDILKQIFTTREQPESHALPKEKVKISINKPQLTTINGKDVIYLKEQAEKLKIAFTINNPSDLPISEIEIVNASRKFINVSNNPSLSTELPINQYKSIISYRGIHTSNKEEVIDQTGWQTVEIINGEVQQPISIEYLAPYLQPIVQPIEIQNLGKIDGKLHAIAIGIEYLPLCEERKNKKVANVKCRTGSGFPKALQFTTRDANDFINTIKALEPNIDNVFEGGLGYTESFLLLESSRREDGEIDDNALTLKFIDEATPKILEKNRESNSDGSNDITLILLSAHGKEQKGAFYLLGSNYDNKLKFSNRISLDEIYSQISIIPGKKVIFIDACRSGTAIGGLVSAQLKTYIDAKKAPKTVTFLASGAVSLSSDSYDDFSYECKQNGCFTTALITGLKNGELKITGKRKSTISNEDGDGIINQAELALFLNSAVKKLAEQMNKTQVPPVSAISLEFQKSTEIFPHPNPNQ